MQELKKKDNKFHFNPSCDCSLNVLTGVTIVRTKTTMQLKKGTVKFINKKKNYTNNGFI